jgi:hypothetical protein
METSPLTEPEDVLCLHACCALAMALITYKLAALFWEAPATMRDRLL